jgi:dTDP-4-amino-4,6-dideoxygalactose transaminase
VQHIPLVDLAAQHAEVADEVVRGWNDVIKRSAFILGDEVNDFEHEYAQFAGVPHCVGVANGTDALELALRAAGIGPGAEVLLPANTFIATALAVVRVGARPVFVDVDDEFLCLDPEDSVRRVTSDSRAVVPVHLYGQLADMQSVASIAAEFGLTVIEDAAQSHGAWQEGTHDGCSGFAAATSFYPGKNLGAYGDAGAVLTRDDAVADRLRALRNYGSQSKHHHPHLGFNSRLDTLQAVVLRAKLRRLPAWNAARTDAAERYVKLLSDYQDVIRLPKVRPGNGHVWHLFVVRVSRRDDVLAALHADGVAAGVHYPVPVHLQGAFSGHAHVPGDFPIAERSAHEVLSLPLHPHLTTEQQEYVVERLVAAVRR